MASQNPMQVSELILKKECEESWKQVNRNQAVLLSQPRHGPVGDSQNALAAISQMKARCLQGEIDAVKAKKVKVLPNDPVILESLLKEDLERNVSQLEECLSVVEGRRRELEDDLARQKELLSQHQDMNRALESRLREAEEGGNTSRPNEDSQIKILKRKQKKAGEIQTVLLKQIGDFVGNHFPLPNASKGRQAGQINYISLLEIIELLMNKGMDGDTDPYVSIHEAFWPPYIELLLRCDIASRHPQDASRIRLVPLHL
ncbi:centromere protein K [Strongylocentrotus purpuratus]|uniref:Centromere protein K n=1 Tax=Strongylocentrotus purpuratus TaxID=7668 RepID=A0A7M7HJT1_STRPU|nr:centromere protein K [Strongylocentrotus purpuratus]XP_011673823.1 centromere protein K [Strongylocentrotus purpuratus]|eukprot:XP_001177614.1 PREDICTED: centromere protein K [Strongylocentrotus purpuratus]